MSAILKCLRCSHVWRPMCSCRHGAELHARGACDGALRAEACPCLDYAPKPPKQCPTCHSLNWDRPWIYKTYRGKPHARPSPAKSSQGWRRRQVVGVDGLKEKIERELDMVVEEAVLGERR